MDTLKVGMQDELVWEVTENLCTKRGDYRVFSTPSMCLFAEMAAHQLIEPYLKPGQGQVGLTVNIRHMAPTPIGKRVRADVELTGIDRRKLTFRVNIFDDVEQVGEVVHERFIVDLDKYMARLKAKAEGKTATS